jgi:hypothetical protein
VNLAATLAEDGGTAAPASAVTVDATTLTLAAGESRTVAVTVTPDALGIGRWTGTVTATTPAGATRTVLSLVKEPVRHTLSLAAVDRDGGAPTFTTTEITDVHTGATYYAHEVPGTLRLPPGTYVVAGYVTTATPDQWETTLDAHTDVRLDRDRTVTFDARGGVPYRLSVEAADAVPIVTNIGYGVTSPAGELVQTSSYSLLLPRPQDLLYAVPTRRARTGRLDFAAAAFLQPDVQFPAYVYSLAEPTRGRIPGNITHRYRDADLARVERTFRGHGAGGVGRSFSVPEVPGSPGGLGQDFRHGTRRVDLMSPGVPWGMITFAFVQPDDDAFERARATWVSSVRTYRRGRIAETFVDQVSGPALPRDGSGPARSGDRVGGLVVPWTDPDGDAAWLGLGSDVEWSLSTGGRTVGRGDDAEVLAAVPAGRHDYRLEVTGRREAADGLALSTAVAGRWTFPSATVAGTDPEPLPLLSLDAALPLDVANSAPRGEALTFAVTGRMPAGLRSRRVTSLSVETSADGGRTWLPATVTRTGAAAFTVRTVPASEAGKVSLRMTARAPGGLTVQQEVEAAYAVR